MRKGNEMESSSEKQKMQDEIKTEMFSSRVYDSVQEKEISYCNGNGLQSAVGDETLACQMFHCEAGLNGNETSVSRTGKKSECVPLGMELRVRSEEERLNIVNRKIDAESELEDNGINKSQWQNVHEASDFVFKNEAELLKVSNQAHAASIGNELMEKSIYNVPGKKADVADVAHKLSEYVEAEAIARDNLSDKKATVVNGGEIMVNQCQANSDYRGKESIEEIEAHKEHGAAIPIEAAMSQHQSFADGGTEERNPEQQGVFIHRKRSIAEADLGGVGTERLKKSLKPEGVDEVSANSAGNEGPNDCHTQRPETAPEDINLETSVCKEGESTTVPRVPRYKKRKIALFVAYCGVGYQGMQRNPGAVTIEGDLEEALFKAGAIAESNFGDPWKVEWMRAARTDKGVSAVGQVVSGRFFIDPAGFVERVNSHLPRQIHVLGYKRVTNTFNAKNLCDRRRYEYVLPVFTFDPSAHLDRESVKQLGGEIKVSICSETRQGTEGTVNEDFKNAAQDITELSQNIPDDVLQGESVREHSEEEPQLENGMEAVDRTLPKRYLKNHTQATDVSNVILRGTVPFDPSMGENEVQQEVHSSSQHNDGEKFGSLGVSSEPVILSKEASVKANFQFGEKHLSHFNSILSHYVGTHNFHNFTSRMKAEDPSAKRYIMSFEACSVFTIGSMEFVKCKVVGQSFMLHQIRKMIGLAVAIARGCAPLSIIETALRRDVKINVPMAPELGLFLDECMYHSYNQKFSSSHEPISLRDFEKDINDFKWEQIYPHIASTEAKEGVVALWLHSLNDRNYPDFVAERQKTE